MAERNVVAQGALRRYLLRDDFFRKVFARWRGLVRLNTKSAFGDQARLLPPESTRVILDVGANIGAVSQIYANRFPRAEIYAFEASPAIFPILENNYAAVPRVHPIHSAVADLDGTIAFNVNVNSGTSSILEPSRYNQATWAAAGKKAQITVPCTTIPTFCARRGIGEIDILKLDIEGAELAALRGCAEWLDRSAVKLIYTEACLTPLYDGQPLLHDLTAFLARHGYHLYNLYQVVESTIGQATITNAIYLSPAFRDALLQRWGTARCGW